MRFLSPSMATVLAVLAAPIAHAVELNAVLKGDVVDQEGLPIPGALVTLESPDLMGTRSAISDDEGRFRFAALPPGMYTVRVEHPTFRTWERPELRLTVGSTVQLPVVMQLRGGDDAVITVTDSSPAVDVEATGSGVVLDARFLRDVPNGRDYQSAIAVAPGVVGSGNANIRGGFDSSNQFYIDGVNTTDPLTNTFSLNLNYDAIDSIEVLTGGMDAEYGRSLGGAVNIITKSGGNDFEGNAFVLYSHPTMTIAPQLEGDSDARTTAGQLVANLGGPLVKDKLWFYASLQGDQFIRATPVDTDEIPRDLDTYPMAPRNWRSLYYYAKVTAQPNEQHRLWLQYTGDPTWIDNVEQDPYTLPSAETVQNQGGWLTSFGHQWTPSDNVLVESQLYAQYSYIDYFPIVWRECDTFDARGKCTEDLSEKTWQGQPIGRTTLPWDADGFAFGPAPYASFNKRRRMSAQTTATFYGDFLGEHAFKTGLQLEFMSSYYVYPGIEDGFPYFEHDGDPTNLEGYRPVQITRYDNDWESYFSGTIGSFYVQDVYKPHPRLTIRPGLRFDLPTLRDDLGRPVFSRLTVAPRFGMAYDLTGDGRTAAFAYYGRFYDTGFLAISDLLRKKSSGYGNYGWDDRTGDWATEPNSEISSTFLRGEELRNPYSDEFNIGVRRDVGHDVGIGLTVAHERSSNFWEDDEVNLIWNQDGSQVIGYRNGTNTAIYRLRTPDSVYNRFTSVELTLTKRFSDNWTMLASYTWSRAYGTNSGDQATGVLDIPEQRPFETGFLAFDRTHAVKVTGSYDKPDAWSLGNASMGYVVGWNSRLYSGTPYRPFVFNDYYGGYYNYNELGADGRYRLPTFAQTDIRFGLQLDTPAANYMVGVNVFNVFNDRTITSVGTAYDPEETVGETNWQEAQDRQDPRRLEILFRGEF